MEEAERLSDRIGLMKNGRIIAEGTMDEIRNLLPSGWEVKIRGTGFDDKVIAQVQSFLDSQLDSVVTYGGANSRNEMTMLVSSSITDISDLFKALEALKARQDLTDYSVSQLSLEAILNQLVQDL
jgi:ABC-type multidrug transport system ATPase subunit